MWSVFLPYETVLDLTLVLLSNLLGSWTIMITGVLSMCSDLEVKALPWQCGHQAPSGKSAVGMLMGGGGVPRGSNLVS